mmetsp:Transcript_26221/g.67432  ORF Transcript_26221/g.67432 Transcript_26221/m.67432 type:complete len:374 (+) Transcript_26221:165-1286(+)
MCAFIEGEDVAHVPTPPPPCPGSAGAKGDSTSAMASLCLEALVGRRVDILLVEYTLNDGVEARRHKEPAATYENLLRRALALHPGAAVFGVGFWGQHFALRDRLYAQHAALAAHYGLGWAAVAPLARALVAARRMSRASMTADDKGHPTAKVYTMLGRLLAVSMIELAACARPSDAATAALPEPLNRVLAGEPPPVAAACDLVGLPKFGVPPNGGGLAHAATLPSWAYLSIRWQGPGGPRRDQKLQLVPRAELHTALKVLRTSGPREEGPGPDGAPGAAPPGLDVVVNATTGRLLLSVCQEGVFRSMYDLRCVPFRVLLQPSGQEVALRPWLGRKYGIFEAAPLLPPGPHHLRVLPAQRPCKPYTCLGALIGM